jgi:hypothetical protein
MEALRRLLRAACANGTLDKFTPAQLRRAPWLLWSGEPVAATFPGLLPALLRRAQGRSAWLRSLIDAWLRDFDPAQHAFAETGHEIARLLRGTLDPRLQKWAEAHRVFAVFDAGQGPSRIASAVLTGPVAPAMVCAAVGLDDPVRANGMFFRALLMVMLQALPGEFRRHTAAEAWRRAVALLDHNGALRFDDIPMAGAVARHALGAWTQGGHIHADAPRTAVQADLVRLIGDPRLQPARWQDAGEAATSLMRSWLAASTLEAFFTLISEMNTGERWEFRREFWRATLRKVAGAEVWIALGSALEQRAKSKRDLAGSYGHLNGRDSQAVMIIRLGDYVFTEWSDVGRLRAYRRGAKECPKLYSKSKTEYVAKDMLVPNSLRFPVHPTLRKGGQADSQGLVHASAPGGLWQGCAAEFLLQHLGVRLTREDYMP